MSPRSPRRRFFYFAVFAVVFLICAPFIIFYSLGYDIGKVGKNFSIFKTGGIYVYSNQNGAKVFLDNKLSDTTSIFQHGILLKKLTPKKYNILVTKDGYIDWHKSVSVYEERVAEAYSLLIPKNPTLLDVPSRINSNSATSSPLISNPEYTDISALFAPKKTIFSTNVYTTNKIATTTLPTIENGREYIEKDGDVLRAIWKGQSAESPFYFCLNTETCQQDFIIYTGNKIGTFEFYPSRNDVLLVANGDKLYAVELDKRSPQNIILLYQSQSGVTVDFRIMDNETLAIKDGKKIVKLSLVK